MANLAIVDKNTRIFYIDQRFYRSCDAMSSNEITIKEIKESLQFLGDWEARYQFLIEIGQNLPEFTAAYKTEENLVQGCMSKVWLIAERAETTPATLSVYGDSDNSMIKGLVALLIAIYSGHTPQRILNIDADEIFADLRLYDHLSPTRHVGVYAMVEKIKSLARKNIPTPGKSKVLERFPAHP